ncbi:MAG: electron transport complex subunit RsxC [Oscillospiraceae bacterium]|nr:electron transport complex subunit RsxC [Oscillospiraceae bacterium]
MPYKFRGGVHPDYMKAPDEPVIVVTPPPQVIIPMAQHIGAPCQPIVAVGDYVKMGQKVGDNPAPVSAPVHSPVSGKVVAIEPRPHPLGDMIMAVVIENDYQDTPCTDLAPLTEEELKNPEAILNRLREAGIVGMGGAMFPTAFKIKGGLGKVDTLIINGAECEPYLNGDHWTMRLHPEELLKGIELARIASGLDKAYYGIEKNKMDAIELLNSKNPAQYGVEIVPEEVKYPQGAEKMQIKAITNREVKPGGLPAGVGCNVVSTQTAYAIYKACYLGIPCYERILTVGGSAVNKPYNLQCRIGTPFRYIVEQCGGFVKTPKKIVLGGPMMGLIATNLDAVNIKGTAGILFFTEEEDRTVENPTCIRCGKCITVCPMGLEPVYMYMYFKKGDFENMQKYHILDCFECGSCSFNCPGRMPLTHSFKTAKLLFAAKAAEEKARAEAAAKEAEKK